VCKIVQLLLPLAGWVGEREQGEPALPCHAPQGEVPPTGPYRTNV
jgi:hypothetical protein